MQTLAKGDVVDIIVPASGCTESEYDAAIEFVKTFGLKPRFRKYSEVIKSGLCANSAEYRFRHLMEALESDSKAVWCLKGGYGTQRFLEMLDELETPPKQKLFIGFSDITILLNYFADKWGWECVHGPMPVQIVTSRVSEESWDNLAGIIFGKDPEIRFSAAPLNKAAREDRNASGKFMGGCLSLVQALLGTSHMPDLEGAILLLEDDRFETPRRIDRIFDHMKRANVFYDVEAVVLGNFLEGAEKGSKDELELQEVLKDFGNILDERGIPLVQNIKLGHGTEMQTTLIGASAAIKLGDKPEVVISL